MSDKQVARKRHILKTITWRALGTVDTITLSWFISGDIKIGFSIGGAELFTKMLLYYAHERIWYKCNFGINNKKDRNGNKLN
jgi:uncharacterized membrane protein